MLGSVYNLVDKTEWPEYSKVVEIGFGVKSIWDQIPALQLKRCVTLRK